MRAPQSRTGVLSVIEVLRAGALTTVQDQGRPGYAHLGVPRSGALDPAALRLANRLVGNPERAAGLEITLTGCDLRFERAACVALTGAEVGVRIDPEPAGRRPPDAGRPGDVGRPLSLPAGAVLRIGPARAGLRTWLAVSGGIEVPPVLGSRATDTLSGLGPPPVRDGDRLPLGEPVGHPAPVDVTVVRGGRDDGDVDR
ncbi:biotin-dependent carboxyltransferase family protein, partial [Micromonospora sicca]|uniref:5-oxoprolinase subunit C family protein n=1 Tax=Micromonospora sicca TaxID=2202420 RepID=UPI001F4739EE